MQVHRLKDLVWCSFSSIILLGLFFPWNTGLSEHSPVSSPCSQQLKKKIHTSPCCPAGPTRRMETQSRPLKRSFQLQQPVLTNQQITGVVLRRSEKASSIVPLLKRSPLFYRASSNHVPLIPARPAPPRPADKKPQAAKQQIPR